MAVDISLQPAEGSYWRPAEGSYGDPLKALMETR